MTPEERLQFNKMASDLAQLQDLFFKNNFTDKQVFDKKIDARDLILVKKGIKFFNGAEIWSGTQINDAGIKAEIGYTSPNGSLYLSTSPSQPLLLMVGTTWTLVNYI